MSIKRRIVSYRYLDFTGYPLQPLIFHEMDMTPWARLPSQNWRRRIHSAFLVIFISPIPRLTSWPNTISRKLPVNATSGVHFIYANVRVRVVVKEEEKYNAMQNVYLNPNPNNVQECIIMVMPTRYSTFLNERPGKNISELYNLDHLKLCG